MSGELLRMVNDEVRVPRADRELVAQARQITNEVRRVAFKADAVQALGCHLMEGLVDVDNHRRRPAQGDASREVMLGEVQAQCHLA